MIDIILIKAVKITQVVTPHESTILKSLLPGIAFGALSLRMHINRRRKKRRLARAETVLERGSPKFREYFHNIANKLLAEKPQERTQMLQCLELEWTIEDDCKNGVRPDLERVFFYLMRLKEIGLDCHASMIPDKISFGSPLSSTNWIYRTDLSYIHEYWDKRFDRIETPYETPQQFVWRMVDAVQPTHRLAKLIREFNGRDRADKLTLNRRW